MNNKFATGEINYDTNGNPFIVKDLSVYVDITTARKSLEVAGFDVKDKSDKEVASLAIERAEIYGVSILPF